MALVATITQSRMRTATVVSRCCVAHITQKSLPRKQLLERLLVAKQRKLEKKLRSD
jgi:hypothetical protein